jgi:hypothetical protein
MMLRSVSEAFRPWKYGDAEDASLPPVSKEEARQEEAFLKTVIEGQGSEVVKILDWR